MKSVFDRTCALRRKLRAISQKLLSVSSRLHFNSFWLILIGNIHLQDFAFSVQAALGLFHSVVYQFACFDRSQKDFAGKRSLPLRQGRPDGSALSGLPKPFTLLSFVRTFFILLALKVNAAAAFGCCGSILILYVLLLHKYKRAEIEQVSCLEILPCPAAVW